jgi:hypothetical protein
MLTSQLLLALESSLWDVERCGTFQWLIFIVSVVTIRTFLCFTGTNSQTLSIGIEIPLLGPIKCFSNGIYSPFFNFIQHCKFSYANAQFLFLPYLLSI